METEAAMKVSIYVKCYGKCWYVCEFHTPILVWLTSVRPSSWTCSWANGRHFVPVISLFSNVNVKSFSEKKSVSYMYMECMHAFTSLYCFPLSENNNRTFTVRNLAVGSDREVAALSFLRLDGTIDCNNSAIDWNRLPKITSIAINFEVN